ncbi:MAG: 3'(2'),5'-bisphosphate nucleotidase CysQ [Niabella sp.]|nr:3'(2'),5'-bisphosphate nucleotidase CysQ [Niabella sp.]
MTEYIHSLLDIVKKAGQAILEIYDQPDISVALKKDASPLTAADMASHLIIVEALQKINPAIPIVSEEGRKQDLQASMQKMFWCVDPLDGTKEFLKRNGEFTVNIGLIVDQKPELGVVYAPVTDMFYYGASGLGSFKMTGAGPALPIRVSKRTTGLVAVGSRSHQHPEEEKFLSGLGIAKLIAKGSSLKLCLVAEGAADIYYRHGPTMEWDTAAGHAVVANAGGRITGLNGDDLMYGKPGMLNPGFICQSDAFQR